MHRFQYAGMKPQIPTTSNSERALGDNETSTLKVNALLSEFTTRLVSGERPGSESIHIEHHKASPYEKAPSTSANHLIALFQNHVARGESAVVPGHFVPFSYFPGTLNLYAQGPIPACRSFGDLTVIVCAIDPGFVSEVGKEIETPSIIDFRRTTNFRDRSLGAILTLLTTETQFGGSPGRLYLDYLAHALVLRFLWVVGNARDANPMRHRVWPHRVLRRILDKMEAEVEKNLDLNALASESGYSRSHFLRLFRAGMGCAPHQWLIQLRVQRAKELLRKSDDSIIDIAAACGFSNHAHLSRTFRHFVGVTPSEYRRSRGHLV